MPQKVFPARLAFLLTCPLRTAITPVEKRLQALGIRPGMRVLDIGCGNGFLLPALVKLVGPTGHVFAIDLQSDLLTEARERVPSSAPVTFITADVLQTGLPDNSLDAIVAHYAFHEFTDRAGAVREFRRMLKTGGVVGLWEPRVVVDTWRLEGWEGLFWGQQFTMTGRLSSPLGCGRTFQAVEAASGSRLRRASASAPPA